jgi:hypothetical protein
MTSCMIVTRTCSDVPAVWSTTVIDGCSPWTGVPVASEYTCASKWRAVGVIGAIVPRMFSSPSSGWIRAATAGGYMCSGGTMFRTIR